MAKDSVVLYPEVPFEYVLPSTIVNEDSLYRQSLSRLIRHYRGYPHLKGIGLFRFGSLFSPVFSNHMESYALTLKRQYNLAVYFTTANENITSDLKGVDWILYQYQARTSPSWNKFHGVIFDGKHLSNPYKQLGKILRSTDSFNRYPILFQDEWLIKALQSKPEFGRYLKTTTKDSVAIYPFQEATAREASSEYNYLVLLFLLVWGIFALHYSIHPVYRRNLFRYFLSHKFFCMDILEWRIRIPDSGYIIFFKHILISSVWGYALGRYYLGPLGTDAIRTNIPYLSEASLWPITFLAAGFLFSLLFQTFSILWLYIFHKRVKHLGQVLLMYSWPLQVNLLGLTILIPLVISGAAHIYILALTTIFALVWILSFYLAAFDISSNIPASQGRYLTITTLPYTLVLAATAGYIFLYSHLSELLQLVALLSR